MIKRFDPRNGIKRESVDAEQVRRFKKVVRDEVSVPLANEERAKRRLLADIISKHVPPSVPVIGVKEGESLWLIEQTDEEGTRRFWAGYYWSTSALDAVRFTEYSAAWGLVCSPWWLEVGNPPRRYEKVDVCEHLFQCGIAPEQSVPMADLDTLAQQWLSDAGLARDDRAIGYRRCASDLFTLIQRAAPEPKP